MDVFAALADPVRRSLLEEVAAGPVRVVDLAATRPISRPAVSKHLRLLAEAGLVTATDRGRERHYALGALRPRTGVGARRAAGARRHAGLGPGTRRARHRGTADRSRPPYLTRPTTGDRMSPTPTGRIERAGDRLTLH